MFDCKDEHCNNKLGPYSRNYDEWLVLFTSELTLAKHVWIEHYVDVRTHQRRLPRHTRPCLVLLQLKEELQ